jgi:hypothetical protein
MLDTKICAECERFLYHAVVAMREHETEFKSAVDFNKSGSMIERDRGYLALRLADSFNAAQASWDAYREHLIGHGLLTADFKKVRIPSPE